MTSQADSDERSNYVDPNDDDVINSKTAKKLSTKEAKQMREWTLQEIEAQDNLCVSALDAFFDNRVKDAEDIILTNVTKDPLAMCGAGLIGFLRFILSVEKEQSDRALTLLSGSSAFSSQLYPGDGIMKKSVMKMFLVGGSSTKTLKPAEFRAKTIHAESQALRCFVLVGHRSIPSYLKAGFAVRRAYNEYTALMKEMDKLGCSGADLSSISKAGLDPNSVCSVEFGFGTMNIVLSVLPPNVRGMLSFLGFTGDKEVGLDLVDRCFRGGTLLAPFASLVLLGMNCVLPSVCPALVESCVPSAISIGKQCLANPKMKNSLIHLWLIGRVRRLTRDVDESIKEIKYCLQQSQSEQMRSTMPQLAHFGMFDLVYNYSITGEWVEAIRYLMILEKESKWSALFYLYSQACCYEMRIATELNLSDEVKLQYRRVVTQLYWLTAHQNATLLGGRPTLVDQFIVKRISEIFLAAYVDHPNPEQTKKLDTLVPLPENVLFENTVPLPTYEQLVLRNLSHQIPLERVVTMMGTIDSHIEHEQNHISNDDPATATLCRAITSNTPITKEERKAIKNTELTARFGRMLYLLGLKAVFYANSGSAEHREIAANIVEIILSTPSYKDKACTLSYVKPFALFEKANIQYFTGDSDGCKATLVEYNSLYNSAHYYNHSNVELKVHLTFSALASTTKSAGKAVVPVSDPDDHEFNECISTDAHSESGDDIASAEKRDQL